jgi:hypothetical protein
VVNSSALKETTMLTIRQDSPSLFDRLVRAVQDWREVAVLSGKLSRLDGERARTLLEREGWIASAQPNAGVQILWRLMRTLGHQCRPAARDKPQDIDSARDHLRSVQQQVRCEQALADGSAASTYREFCPNGAAIEAMIDPGAARRPPEVRGGARCRFSSDFRLGGVARPDRAALDLVGEGGRAQMARDLALGEHALRDLVGSDKGDACRASFAPWSSSRTTLRVGIRR